MQNLTTLPSAVPEGSCYLTPSTPASHIKGACTRGGVVWHGSGFGLDFALVILALVLVWLFWCVLRSCTPARGDQHGCHCC